MKGSGQPLLVPEQGGEPGMALLKPDWAQHALTKQLLQMLSGRFLEMEL